MQTSGHTERSEAESRYPVAIRKGNAPESLDFVGDDVLVCSCQRFFQLFRQLWLLVFECSLP